jgi:hypothetical protein
MKKLIAAALVGVAAVVPVFVQAESPGAQADANDGAPFFTVESVVVDEVLGAEENGFRSNTYVVTWNNSRVAVEDPLARSNYRVGDKIKIMVMRIQVNNNPKVRLLDFAVAQEKTELTKSPQFVGPTDVSPSTK